MIRKDEKNLLNQAASLLEQASGLIFSIINIDEESELARPALSDERSIALVHAYMLIDRADELICKAHMQDTISQHTVRLEAVQ